MIVLKIIYVNCKQDISMGFRIEYMYAIRESGELYDNTDSKTDLMYTGSTRGHGIGDTQVDKIDGNDASYNFSLYRDR